MDALSVEETEGGDLVLETRAVVKNFRSGTREIAVLQGVDLELRACQSLSIRGESGSGKSTLLNILAGLEQPDGGEVRWQGRSLGARSLASLARERAAQIGMVFQSFYLIPELNALENVLMAARVLGQPLKASRQRAQSLLERVGLGDRLDGDPARLSGGERQRVALARALMNRPRVILADEPTGNLDESTGAAIMDLLLEVTQEERSALVLVTHNPAHAQRTHRHSRMQGGILHY